MLKNYISCVNCEHDKKEHKGMNCQLCDCKNLYIFVDDNERQRLIDIRKQYYSMPVVKSLLCSNINVDFGKKTKRETSFLTKAFYKPKKVLRYAQCYNSEKLDLHFKSLSFINSPFTNIYYSLAHLNFIPKTSINLVERTKLTDYVDFNEQYSDYVKGYDILFDFDLNESEGIDTLEKVHSQAKAFKEILEDKKIPYSLKFSGSKGFHIMIPFEMIDFGIMDYMAFIEKALKFVSNIHWAYDLKAIDLSVTDIKQLCKVPYSLDLDKIALPLTDEQFKHFNPNLVSFDSIVNKKQVTLYNRGNLIRSYQLMPEQLAQNFKKFFDEYS